MKKIRPPYNKPTIRIITEQNHTTRKSDPVIKINTPADVEQGQRCVELWRTVLLQTMHNATKGDAAAQKWMESKSTSPTSFYWCCSLFDIEPDILIRELQKRMEELDSRE